MLDLKRKAGLNRDTDRPTMQVKRIWDTCQMHAKSREFTVQVSLVIGATCVILLLPVIDGLLATILCVVT